ncbi:kinase-like domain-containing protein [Glomus cerebriforme]|uniref:Kinase-like domain-containing protein n=1 Tax=Glomus cerebriforme TaxID=658196 RepID=A0A397TDU4_9GLOM|nr:kinase-like domain-containing protein [Glomus cerebriforme]
METQGIVIAEDCAASIQNENNLNDKHKKKDNGIGFGYCKKCCNPRTDFVWCTQCDTSALIDVFSTWTSGNSLIDKAIQKTQKESKTYIGYLEFIPYDRFSKIEILGQGGFGTVFKAYWSDGEKCYYRKVPGNRYFLTSRESSMKRVDPINDELLNKKTRTTPIYVVLKFLHNSDNISEEFLNEVMIYYGCNNRIDVHFLYTFNCYGITRHPETGNYGMVLPYAPEGDLRQYLKKNHMKLSWYDKVEIMLDLVRNLHLIHEKGFVHGDIHSGNILHVNNRTYIVDLGLARPADRPASDENGTHGIITYMAPEILQGQPRTQASDIYALGIVLYEICSGKAPFHDKKYDGILQYQIWKGLRPEPEDGTPKCMISLMKLCWDDNPSKRPNSLAVLEIIRPWFGAISLEISNLDFEDTGTLKPIREDIDQAEQKRLILNSNLTTAKSHPEVHTYSQYVPYVQMSNANDILRSSTNDSNIDSADSFWNLNS